MTELGCRFWRAGRAFAGVAALGLACLGCDAADPSAPREESPLTPLRVVSLDPAASAFVLELGAGSRLVAVDRESARLPGLGALPVTTLADAPQRRPDLVLVSALRPEDAADVARLRALDSEVREVAPRNFDDVFALSRELGVRLAGEARAATYEGRLGRELAALAAESHGRARPLVAAVRRLDPLELAPAHGFETDLIELAGGTSTAHAHEPTARPASLAQLVASAPDLVLVVGDSPWPASARAQAEHALGSALPVAFFALDRERFWVRDGSDAVRRLRALLARVRDERMQERQPAQSP